ncbi:hypothetical protein [Rhizobium hainanense]|uniref:Uncharacterized protein n=1 Tax=Rhizobium hainanense TaxID=52131 RepID=A0A1C3WKH4_9HYPH|nr:hypothetical protein [Rhizobium hainanense]SCB40459.1 hypothetical protein GA0061100_1259 [Rhizobium hainanense]
MTSEDQKEPSRWWEREHDANLTETRIFMSTEQYEKIARMATDLEERIPILLGKLIADYFDAVESGQLQITLPSPAPRAPLEKTKVSELCDLVLWSRFPGETGAHRFRQIALLTTLAHEHELGKKPTASSIARMVDSHSSQIDLMAKLLEKRGVIDRVHTPSIRPGVFGKVLYIKPDAAAGLKNAHLLETNLPLEVQESE